MKIRVRLTLISATILALLLAGTALAMTITLRYQLRSTLDAGLLARADALEGTLSGNGSGPVGLGGGSLVEPEESILQLVDASGEVLLSSAGLTGSPVVGPEDRRETELVNRELDIDGESIPVRVLVAPLQDGRYLLVGASLEDIQEASAALAAILLVGGPALAALAALLIWGATGAALKPVDRLRMEADALSVSDEGRLLGVPSTGDEIARLAESLNGLLGRLGDALRAERRLVDDASHELRTPVTRLKAELELALTGPERVDEMRVALASALSDADDMARLIDDLLILARADQGRLPVRREPVHLKGMFEQVVAGFSSRAREKGVTLRAEAEGDWDLDPLRMRQILNNLLENALRHSPDGGTVQLLTRTDEDLLTLEVCDEGPGFPAVMLDRPFQRFAGGRPDGDRGVGLGLAIVEAVVSAHGGEISIANRAAGGARVTVRIPAAAY